MKVSTNNFNLFFALFLTCGGLAYGGDPTPLWPTGQFNVTKLLNAPKAVYHGFKASGDHLYFLFSTGPTTDNSSLVETDLDGNLVRLTSLGRSPILDFSVGSTGEVEVLQLPPVGDAIWRSLAIDGDQPNGGLQFRRKCPKP